MANSNEGPPIRLRPRRSKRNPNDDPRRYAGVVGSVLRFAQMTNRARRRRSQSQFESVRQFRSSRLGIQRVSVRVTYAKNKNQGQWKAHGRYIARDSATHGGDPSRAGFDAVRTDLNIASVLDSWQRAGDERLFKVIVSPEFGLRPLIRRIKRIADARGCSINQLVNSGLVAYYSKERVEKRGASSRPTRTAVSASYDKMSPDERQQVLEELAGLAGLQEGPKDAFPDGTRYEYDFRFKTTFEITPSGKRFPVELVAGKFQRRKSLR